MNEQSSDTFDPTGIDDLVDRAVQGEPAAIEQLIGRILPAVVRYCRTRIPSGATSSLATADDIAQEACLAVLTALPTFRREGKPFLAFVYGIAAHKLADAHRASARNRAEPTDNVPERFSGEAGPEQLAIDADASARMEKLLAILPEKQREILILRVVVGMSAEETAEAVGSTPGAVRVAQHRALARLKSEITTGGEHA